MNHQGKRKNLRRVLLSTAVISAIAFNLSTVQAQEAEESPSPPPPLSKNIRDDVPEAPWIDRFVTDTKEAMYYLDVLGKAFFWDQQVGSDGQACASCHSVAGADQRSKNQLSPGILAGDNTFDATATGGGGINYQLVGGDFPFHQKVDPDSRDEGSNIHFDTNDVASSMGVFNTVFNSVDPVNHTINDDCSPGESDEFDGVRRVEPRHTPTVINAALNFDNFWDGRANNVFNGGVLGLREFVELFNVDSVTGTIESGALEDLVDERLVNASLASQAVGPIESPFEMSCAGRDAADIGEKLMDKTPLYFQEIHRRDHLLKGALGYDGKIAYTYRELIQMTFLPEWWDTTDLVSLNGRQYEMIEANFPIFFGLAVMAYERKLVSNMSKFDRVHRSEGDVFTSEEEAGQDVFLNKGKCVNCHSTAAFTKASTLHLIDENEEEGLVERMLMGDQDRGPALYDNGWYNTSITRTNDDLSRGFEFFDDPLSFTLQYIEMLRGKNVPDPFEIDECQFEIRFDGTVFPGELETIQCKHDDSSTLKPSLPLMDGDAQDLAIQNMRTAVNGAQKTASLRNLSVTGPFFHNGGSLTLQQVIDFYDRGGNFFKTNESDVDPDINRLELSDEEKANLEAFLRTLMDPNVLDEARQFSRPQLFLPIDGTVTGAQIEACMTGAGPCTGISVQPAIGKKGRSAEGLALLAEFEDTL